MAVSKGDPIEATPYNNYVMGLSYADKIEHEEIIRAFHAGGGEYTKDIWMRGARTDKDGVALPSPYPSYNTFHIHVNSSVNTLPDTEVMVEISEVTWDTGGEEIVTPVSGSPFRDTSFFSTGTDYYRFFEPGLYRVTLNFQSYTTGVFRTTRSAYVEFKPWQNQVEADSTDPTEISNVRVFTADRSGLYTLGYGAELIAGNASQGYYGDPFYLGGNHPSYSGD